MDFENCAFAVWGCEAYNGMPLAGKLAPRFGRFANLAASNSEGF
jgi:hypothetical protein